MNSAPSSAGVEGREPGLDQTRPPMRPRASSTTTRAFWRASVRAAANPAAPAPMTIASASIFTV
jgi:hypothetical protein